MVALSAQSDPTDLGASEWLAVLRALAHKVRYSVCQIVIHSVSISVSQSVSDSAVMQRDLLTQLITPISNENERIRVFDYKIIVFDSFFLTGDYHCSCHF